MENSKTTVIIGGNGKTGRRVADRLKALGRSVRPVSRSSSIPFDWTDPKTWDRALAGAQALYLTYHPDLAVPGAAAHVEQLTERAVQQGIEKIVLLAGRGEPQVHPAEDAVRNSGVEHTILECSFFNQNFTEGLLAPVEGTIYFPAGEITEPFIDCDDIADTATKALIEPGHQGKTYELTGPESLSFHQVAEYMSQASGQSINYVPVSFEQYAEMLKPHLPPAHIEFFVSLFKFLLDGHNSQTTSGVQEVLNRPAKSILEFAQDAFKGNK